MLSWTFYAVFVGTIVSVISLTRVALQNYTHESPRTLSELAAAEDALLRRFRNILLFCGILFAITLFGFIVPQTSQSLFVVIFGVLMIGGELLLALVPARGKTSSMHLVLAQIMAVGMLGLSLTLSIALAGVFSLLVVILAVCMAIFALLTVVDKKRFILYELSFIFSSHFSIIIAANAFR